MTQSSPDLFSEAPKEPPEPHIYSVRELTGDIQGILEAAFESVWVEGEISNLRVAASQHAYFVLKDDKAQIRCVLFKGYRAGIKYQPEDGDQVLLFGRVTVYGARGEYQVIVENLEPRGLGALQKAFEQLKAKLGAEGLFADSAKKPLPEYPWNVGVITSPTGAAVRDILQIIRRRNPLVSVLLHPVKVQGEGAAQEIAAAIREMNRLGGLDVLIIGRGGGSLEDLWAFNEEIVARAIAASKIPVVSAVGHEIDFTIADFAADLRAPTPSAAAELTVPVLDDALRRIHNGDLRLLSTMNNQIQSYRERLRGLIERRFFRQPRHILEPGFQRLDELNHRLIQALDRWAVLQKQRLEGLARQLFQATPAKIIRLQEEKRGRLHPALFNRMKNLLDIKRERFRAVQKRLGRISPETMLLRKEEQRAGLHHRLARQAKSRLELEKKRFEGAVKNLNALSPLSILDRGYAICTHNEKALLKSRAVKPGDQVRVRLSEGKLDCTVDDIPE